MPLITQLAAEPKAGVKVIHVSVSRSTLSHRRWRSRAEDGSDIAVSLDTPCRHNDCLWSDETRAYVVRQEPEAVFEISIPDTPEAAAALGWFFGNQHCPVQITNGKIWLEAGDQMADLLTRHHIGFDRSSRVFAPPAHSAGHGHHHAHAH